MTCSNCFWFVKGNVLDQGTCHRYPPTTLFMGNQVGSFPTTVKAGNNCGEHKELEVEDGSVQ